MKRRQCKKCPWRKSTNPRDIPNGYCEVKHAALKKTIATPGNIGDIAKTELRLMACHESKVGRDLVCVGWLAHQLGPGNNLGLRMLAMRGKIDTDFELVGEQHERFEDTLPQARR